MSHLKEDARFALRSLVKRPSASLLLVTTLALGLSANAVIFNVLDAVVLRAFAFPNQPRLVRVHETSRDFDGVDLSNVAPANLIDWQAQTAGVVSDLVGLQWWDASLRGRESAERVQGYRVGASFFEALGVAPAEGRGFLAEEASPGQERRVVVGQLATALTLLVAAGVAVQSAATLVEGPQGFEPRGVLAFDVTLAEARYSDAETQRAFVCAVETSPSCRGSRASRSAIRCRGAPATPRGRSRSRGSRSR